MKRSEAREMAMNLLFQMDFHNEYTLDFINIYLEELEEQEDNQVSYIRAVGQNFIDHMKTIDAIIEEKSNEWKLNRMAKVDLAILRVAITELKYFEDIPNSVSINEAVEMAKTFSTEESGSFVNGILGNITKEN